MPDMTPNPTGLYIKEITLPSGSTYEIVDQGAREIITNLSSYTDFLGVTTSDITDGTTSPVVTIGGSSVTAIVGNIVIKTTSSTTAGMKAQEYIYTGATNGWQLFGDISAENLGNLAYKNSATGNYIKFTGVTSTSSTISANGAFTPSGSVSFTGTATTVTVTGTFVNSASLTTTNTNLKISSTTTAPAAADRNKYWNYTPEGSVAVSASATGGSTTKAYVSITGRQVVSGITTAAPTTSTITGGINYTNVVNHNLQLGYIVSNTANAISASTSADVIKNVGSITASGSFTGTGIWAEQFTVAVPTQINLGTSTVTSKGTYTPTGSASFSGTAGTVSVTSTTTFITTVGSTTATDTITVS